MRKPILLFDLGNTLVEYFRAGGFTPVLWESIRPAGQAMSSAFMGPIFATARRYDDTLDTLSSLRVRGYRIGILSNAPWGTPPWAWHEELKRHGLAELCDLALFCGEVGWRKPALPLFRAALNHFGCRAEECLFVGDDPRWDVYGARRAGITPLLIDRTGTDPHGALPQPQPALRSLADLEPILQRWNGGSERGASGVPTDTARESTRAGRA